MHDARAGPEENAIWVTACAQDRVEHFVAHDRAIQLVQVSEHNAVACGRPVPSEVLAGGWVGEWFRGGKPGYALEYSRAAGALFDHLPPALVDGGRREGRRVVGEEGIDGILTPREGDEKEQCGDLSGESHQNASRGEKCSGGANVIRGTGGR
jgi:hypothetical protein